MPASFKPPSIPLERTSKPTMQTFEAPRGLAKCCNTSPVFLITGGSACYYCPVCGDGKGKGGWSHRQPWIASIWNKQHHKAVWVPCEKYGKKIEYLPQPELDVPGWAFAELEYEFHPAWGEK